MPKNIFTILETNGEKFLGFLKLGNDILNTTLGDPSAIKEPILFSADKRYATSFEDLHVTSRIGIKNAIQLFNSSTDDIDEDKFLGTNPGDTNAVISFSEDSPIIKYVFQLHAAGGIHAEVGGLKFGIEKNSEIKTLSYLKHDKDEKVTDALLNDLQQFKFPFLKDHIQDLRIGEGVQFSANGTLGISLDFDFTDMFSGGLAGVSALSKATGLLMVDVAVGLNTKVHASIEDAFEIGIGKISGTQYEIVVKKSISKSAGIGLALGINVVFAEPALLEKTIDGHSTQLIGALTGKLFKDESEMQNFVQTLENFMSGEGKLTDFIQEHPTKAKITQKLIEKFGLTDEEDKIRTLTNKLKFLKSNVIKGIKEGIRQKLEVSFGYEYQRISKHEELLRATVDQSVLREFHSDLIRFKTNDLLTAAAKPDSKIQLKQFFREKELFKRRSWGINIGIGNFKIRGSDFKEIEYKESLRLQDNGLIHRKVSFDSSRGYKGKLLGIEDNWWANFQAEMASFSHDPIPSVSEFDFGFQFIYEHSAKKFRRRQRENLMQLLDRAACWRIIPEDQVIDAFNEIWPKIKGKTKNGKKDRDLNFQYSLNITPSAFSKMRHDILRLASTKKEQHLDLIAMAKGRVMPYLEDFELRKNIAKRTNVYGTIWKQYLKNSGYDVVESIPNRTLNLESFLGGAKKLIDKADNKKEGLGKFELRFASGNEAGGGRLGQILKNNPDTTERWEAFTRGILSLTEAISNNTNHNYEKVIKQAHRDMARVWSQSHDLLASGVYFLLMTGGNPDIMGDIERTLEIQYQDDENKEQVILIRGV